METQREWVEASGGGASDAEDCEVEDVAVTITPKQFDAAVNTVSDKHHRPFMQPLPLHDFLVELKKELGL